MASKLPTNSTYEKIIEFDSVAIEIMKVFNPLIAELIARRDNFLKDLSNLKSDYSDKEIARKNAIEEIKNAQSLTNRLILEDKDNIAVHNEATRLYKKRLKQLETPTKLQRPYFNYPRLKELQTLIAGFGEIQKTAPEDSLKKDKLRNREPKKPPCFRDPEYIGRLDITVVRGRLNKSYSVFGLDPYCKLTIGDAKYITEYDSGKNPSWHQCFKVALQQSTTEFDLEIFDAKLLSYDLLIAWTHIEIPIREIPLWRIFKREVSIRWEIGRWEGRFYLVGFRIKLVFSYICSSGLALFAYSQANCIISI